MAARLVCPATGRACAPACVVVVVADAEFTTLNLSSSRLAACGISGGAGVCSSSYGAVLRGSELAPSVRSGPVPFGGGDAGGDKRSVVTFGAKRSPTTAAIAAAVARVAAFAHCAATFAASAAALLQVNELKEL